MSYDAVIVGGSFAGLSAATYLARARRSVCVIDAGLPRNRFAAHSHGFLGHDGDDPGRDAGTRALAGGGVPHRHVHRRHGDDGDARRG